MKKPIQFGKYYLLDRINVGGMAEVFRAKAFGVEGFERLLAVKRILPTIAEDKEFISMFIDEAKIAVQLSHANICQIFDLGKVDDAYFIALEFVHGKDLRSLFDRCKQRPEAGGVTMPIAQACFIVMKVCEGLDYAHNKKDSAGGELHLVHRDVSPQNVLISYEGEVKLIDFGIAKSVNKASRTQAGILKGKFGYMSPEQVRGLPLDRRSDVFSVAIVLYEMLTGERLFTGESDFSTLEKVRNVEILPPSTYNRKIPDELERIVLKGLAKDVEDRYQNAIDLHDDLQAFMYTAGEFYSRKDLALWMKKQWAAEIQAETAKLESYRNMTPPVPVTPPPRPKGALAAAATQPPASALRKDKAAAGDGRAAPQELWDDDELETHVYDTPKDASDAVVDETDEVEPVDVNQTPVDLQPIQPATGPQAGQGSGNPPWASSEPTPSGTATTIDPPFVLPSPSLPFDAPPTIASPKVLSRWVYGSIGGVVAVAAVVGVGAFVYNSNRPGELQIASLPADGIRILIDNKPVRAEGGKVKLDPGVYSLVVERADYVQWRDRVEIKAGEVQRKNAVLVPLLNSGFTLLSEPPGASVALDGKDLGEKYRTPVQVGNISPGGHRIEVRLAGRANWSQTVTLEPGKTKEVRATLLLPGAPSSDASKAKELPKVEPPKAEPPAKPEPPKAVVQPTLPATAPPAAIAKATATPPPVKPAPAPAAAAQPTPPLSKPASVASTKPVPAPAQPTSHKAKRGRHPDPPFAQPLPDRETDKPKLPRLPTDVVERNEPPTKSAAAGEGYLRINSKPWTKIAVDGRETGLNTPQTHMRLGAGSHRVTLSNPQFSIKETFSVEIKAGETETVIKDLRSDKGD